MSCLTLFTEYSPPGKKGKTVHIQDPAVHDMYASFIEQAMPYSISCLKFLSFGTPPGSIKRPTYVPKKYTDGFEKCYHADFNLATTISMQSVPSHRYITLRQEKKLSLLPLKAYQEIFYGDDNEDRNSPKIMPMHHWMKVNYNNPNNVEKTHPCMTEEVGQQFIDMLEGTNVRHIDRKRDRMIFYARTFGAIVQANVPSDHPLLGMFNETLQTNCDCITKTSEAYSKLVVGLKTYI